MVRELKKYLATALLLVAPFTTLLLIQCGGDDPEDVVNNKDMKIELRVPTPLKNLWQEVDSLRVTIIHGKSSFVKTVPYSSKSNSFKAILGEGEEPDVVITETFKMSIEALKGKELLFYGRKDELKITDKIQIVMAPPNRFFIFASLQKAVWGHTQTVYDNESKILIFGGSGKADYADGVNSKLPDPMKYDTETMAVPQLIDYASGRVWSSDEPGSPFPEIPKEQGPRRIWHTATKTTDGKIVIIGGLDENREPISKTLIFDPATGGVTAQENALLARWGHQTLPHPKGGLFIIGGFYKEGSEIKASDTIITYNPEKNEGGTINHKIPIPIAFHRAILLQNNETIFISGGINLENPEGLNNVFVYDSRGVQQLNEGEKSNLSKPRLLHDAQLLANGDVYIVGGYISGEDDPKPGDLGDIYFANYRDLGVLHALYASEELDPLAGRFGVSATILGSSDLFIYGGIERKSGVNLTIAKPYLMRPLQKPSSTIGIALSYDAAGGADGTSPLANTADRSFAQTNRLIDGMVIISGGINSGGVAISEVIGFMEPK